MDKPNKLFIVEEQGTLIVNYDKNDASNTEYIRKDVLLEWLTLQRCYAKKGSIAMNLYQQVIDKVRGL